MNKAEVEIYPNPFSHSATIIIYDLQITSCDLIIYSLLGEKVRQSSISNNQYTIKRENLPVGIYFYKLTGDNKMGTKETISTGKLAIQ